MKIATFLKHWRLSENPFKAEEARQDNVFARLHGETAHPDFEKIAGDLSRPASAVVFGEKGSGKTAIRLQIEEAIGAHNEAHAEARCFTVAYDELNPFLDRLVRRARAKTPEAALEEIRLVDHIDGILAVAVPRAVDAAVADPALRKLPRSQRQDWLLLQALYDRPDQAVERGLDLRRALGARSIAWARPLKWAFTALLVVLVVMATMFAIFESRGETNWGHWVGLIATSALVLAAGGRVALYRFRLGHMARQLSRQLRFLDRSAESFRASLERIPDSMMAGIALPTDDLDDPRYSLLQRLLRTVDTLGYKHIVVLIDRIDEPTLVSGDTERMRHIIWPLFNNKFLQQDHIALKMMLPLELRHELYRQSGDFFQEARLDKQNLVDRLQWSGATLYDLCVSRMHACTEEGAEPLSLRDLFDDNVTRQDIVDALDQMKQPRDAFKMMYQLIQDHCSHTTEEEETYQIPKLVLDQVRRAQSDRLEGLQRGFRPA